MAHKGPSKEGKRQHRADALPLKFNVTNYSDLELPRLELYKIAEQWLPQHFEGERNRKTFAFEGDVLQRQYRLASEADEAEWKTASDKGEKQKLKQDILYDHVHTAFMRANLALQYDRSERTGPNASDRIKLAKQVKHLTEKLLFTLTSKREASRKSQLGDAQYYLFSAANQLQAAQDALPALMKLSLAATGIQGLEPIMLGGNGSPASRGARGRPIDAGLDHLFRELMVQWEKLTGLRPDLKITRYGAVTCRFCLFFDRYFGGTEKRLRARAIRDRCRKLLV